MVTFSVPQAAAAAVERIVLLVEKFAVTLARALALVVTLAITLPLLAVISPATSSFEPGVVVPIPTLPLAKTVNPEPAVEFDWILATIPEVEAPVLATFNKPLVEFTEAFDVVKFNKLPVVKALALTESGDCVVAVDQFQVCAFNKLSIVLVPDAAVRAESELLPPPTRLA